MLYFTFLKVRLKLLTEKAKTPSVHVPWIKMCVTMFLTFGLSMVGMVGIEKKIEFF